MTYRAALLDLDDTTLDRDASVALFIDRFAEEFSPRIDPAFRPKLKAVFIEIDDKGLKPREEMFAELLGRFAWTCKPEIREIRGLLVRRPARMRPAHAGSL